MTVSMTGKIERVEGVTAVQRRRRWSAEEKAAIVQETYAPGMSVSLVARQHGIAPNQLFTWRRLYADGALSGVGAGEEVVPASEYRALHHHVRELQRLLGKKTLENEILREARELARQKNGCCGPPRPRGTARREGDLQCARRGALQSCHASGSEAEPATARPSSTARGRASHRDQGANCRSAHLRLPPHPRAAPASASRTGRRGSEREAGLSRHEGARSAAPATYR